MAFLLGRRDERAHPSAGTLGVAGEGAGDVQQARQGPEARQPEDAQRTLVQHFPPVHVSFARAHRFLLQLQAAMKAASYRRSTAVLGWLPRQTRPCKPIMGCGGSKVKRGGVRIRHRRWLLVPDKR